MIDLLVLAITGLTAIAGSAGADLGPGNLQAVQSAPAPRGISTDTILKRVWTANEMKDEIRRYVFTDPADPNAEYPRVVVLSGFLGVGKLWSDLAPLDREKAAYALVRRDEIADHLRSLPRVQDSVLADQVQVIKTERTGDWFCVTGVGCYPKGYVVGIVDISQRRADELCALFHQNDWLCVVADP